MSEFEQDSKTRGMASTYPTDTIEPVHFFDATEVSETSLPINSGLRSLEIEEMKPPEPSNRPISPHHKRGGGKSSEAREKWHKFKDSLTPELRHALRTFKGARYCADDVNPAAFEEIQTLLLANGLTIERFKSTSPSDGGLGGRHHHRFRRGSRSRSPPNLIGPDCARHFEGRVHHHPYVSGWASSWGGGGRGGGGRGRGGGRGGEGCPSRGEDSPPHPYNHFWDGLAHAHDLPWMHNHFMWPSWMAGAPPHGPSHFPPGPPPPPWFHPAEGHSHPQPHKGRAGGFGAFGGFGARGGFVVSMDVTQMSDAHIVTFDVPGIQKTDLTLTFQRHQHSKLPLLILKGERKTACATSSSTEGVAERPVVVPLVAERRFGRFECKTVLPADAAIEAASASLQEGVLTVTVPRREMGEEREGTVDVRMDGAGEECME